MHSMVRAPVLSATRSRVLVWITRLPPRPRPASVIGACSRPGWAAAWMASVVAPPRPRPPRAAPSPARATISTMRQRLVARQRPRLHDAHGVTDARLVALVVRLELGGQADDALVERVAREPLDGDDDRLVHLVGHHAADLGLAHCGPLGARLRSSLASCSGRCVRLAPRGAASRSPSAALGLDGQQPRDRACASARSGCSRSAGGWPAGSEGRRGGGAGVASSARSSGVGQLADLSRCPSPTSFAHQELARRPAACGRRGASPRLASASGTPAISNRMRPGLTTATQWSGAPLPEPMRTSAGFLVTGLSGKIADPDLAAALDVARHGTSGGLDLAAGDPGRLLGHQRVIAEGDGRCRPWPCRTCGRAARLRCLTRLGINMARPAPAVAAAAPRAARCARAACRRGRSRP